MHIVIGHKVLNLEELYNVSYLDFTGSEVIVDNQLHADLSTKDAGNAAPKPFAASGLGPLFRPQLRAVLLVKIVQILKLKKIAQRSTIDFLVDALNSNYAWESEKVDVSLSDTLDPLEFTKLLTFVIEWCRLFRMAFRPLCGEKCRVQ